MQALIILFVYCVLIALASYFGGWLPSLLRLTHTTMQIVMSLVGGFMLGVALLHLIPHSAVHAGSIDVTMYCTAAGLIVMFLVIRTFNVHQHAPDEVETPAEPTHHAHEHGAGEDEMCHHPGHRHRLTWVGLAFGFSLHTVIDGLALAASVAADSAHAPGAHFHFAGLATFVAVFLHKPLDSLSITSVMAMSGYSIGRRRLVNALFAMICPIAALAFYGVVISLAGAQSQWLGWALGFAAGVFLCIALADLLPEIQFHSHDRLVLSICLVLGVALAAAIGIFEPDHAHGPAESGRETQSAPDHEHGDHGENHHEDHVH